MISPPASREIAPLSPLEEELTDAIVILPPAVIVVFPPPTDPLLSNEYVRILPETALRLTSPPIPCIELELIRPVIILLLAFRSILPASPVLLKLRIFPKLIFP